MKLDKYLKINVKRSNMTLEVKTKPLVITSSAVIPLKQCVVFNLDRHGRIRSFFSVNSSKKIWLKENSVIVPLRNKALLKKIISTKKIKF